MVHDLLMGITRPFLFDFDIACFLETNRMLPKSKLYLLCLRFRFLATFLLRGITWATLRAWTQNHPQNAGTCPGLPLQLISQNRGFQNDRPNPLYVQCTLVQLSSYTVMMGYFLAITRYIGVNPDD